MKNNWNFTLKKNNNLLYLTIPSFVETNLVNHCFTTKAGGVSLKPYEGLNLGTNTLDKKEYIEKNYSIISSELGINPRDIIISDQVHDDRILRINKYHQIGKDIFNTKLKGIDGLITNEKNVALITLYADCVPIFFLDTENEVVGLSHAGWRGTVKKIGKKTVEKMVKEFDSDPSKILVGIGPSIGPCCYEIDEKVIRKFEQEYKYLNDFVVKKSNSKYILNLWAANKISLLEAGLKEENITISNVCTKCNNNLFYSYRGNNGITGRMAAIIQLK